MLLQLDDQPVKLGSAEARLLVQALWTIAASTPGAVVAIGKIEHALSQRDEVVQLAQPEVSAVRVALGDVADALPALARLRESPDQG